VTTERGLDAGSFAMVVYGGAGPLHASAIAREIGIRRVLIPYSPGHFSAYGMLFGDLRYDYVRSCFQRLETMPFETLDSLYQELEALGRDAIGSSAVRPEAIEVTRYADMRYVGQEHAVTVELPPAIFESRDRQAIKAAFDAVHLQRYGTSAPQEPADLVSVRATVTGIMRKPPRHSIEGGDAKAPADAVKRVKKVFFRETGFVDTTVYDRERLLAGNRIQGPALIEEHASTTVLWPTDALVVDGFGNLDITIGDAA
jgi:N-methylhydantoinase A